MTFRIKLTPVFLSVIFLIVSLLPQLLYSQPLIHPPGDSVIINGKAIWYESEGKGEPLILIAGGPGSSHAYFHPFFSSLSDSFRIIYYDAFGTGKSETDKKAKNYSMANDVEILEGLRKTLKLKKINILGHSYGGFVAQLYAVKYADHLNHLILCNTIPSGEDMQVAMDYMNMNFKNHFPEGWDKLMKLRKRGVLASSPEHQQAYNFPGLLINFYNPANASKISRLEPNLYNADLWYAMAGKDADFVVSGEMLKYDVRQKLRTLKVPTLVIAGRFDRNVRPSLTIQYKKLMLQAEFIMFEKSGHFPFVEETKETIEIIRRFLSEKSLF
jgi:proline iminopeptidase